MEETVIIASKYDEAVRQRMRKHHIRITLAIILLIGSLLFVGCSASKESAPGAPDYPPSDWREKPGDAGYDAGYDAEYDNNFQDNTPGKSDVSPLPGTYERKFIENGFLELRSVDVDETFRALSDLAKSLGGRVVSYEQNVGETFKTITMQVAVPYGKLTDFMEHAGESSTKIESQSVKSDEVTEDYYDTKLRIESTEKLIEHYRALLAEAKTIEETLQVQWRIDELTVQLEGAKGHLRLLNYLTQESHISITIRMEKDPTVAKPEVTLKTLKWSDVGYLMKSGLQKAGIIIALGFQYFLIFLVYASPVIVFILIVLLIVWLVRRNKRKKRAALAAAAESKASPPQPETPPQAEEVPVEAKNGAEQE